MLKRIFGIDPRKPFVLLVGVAWLVLTSCSQASAFGGAPIEPTAPGSTLSSAKRGDIFKGTKGLPTRTITPSPTKPMAEGTPPPLSRKYPFEGDLGLELPLSTSSPTPASWKVCSPLQGYPRDRLNKIVSAPYDPPPMGSDDRHQGVDFAYHSLAGVQGSIEGVGVQSVMPGRVAASIQDSFPYGNVIIIETPYTLIPTPIVQEVDLQPGFSIYTLYAHLQEKLEVTLGEDVSVCQLVGYVGKSGNTAAAHLHLEMRIGPASVVFEGMSAFVPGVTPEERANYMLWRMSGTFLHFDPMRILSLDY